MRSSILFAELPKTLRVRKFTALASSMMTTTTTTTTRRGFCVTSSQCDLRNYKAVNEPVLDFAKNSPERAQIERKLEEFMQNASKIGNDQREALFEVPIVIGDKEVGYDFFLLIPI